MSKLSSYLICTSPRSGSTLSSAAPVLRSTTSRNRATRSGRH
ncbi:hypothetical protein N181_00965 [Sinorhizobium fredii USDA 205]|nr:Stf0 sulfotransferase family protein [Sinorhizobium fredii]KSV92736.1 hypothetical protein N181_00965 [Sinorhizobium fredii USDA 205]